VLDSVLELEFQIIEVEQILLWRQDQGAGKRQLIFRKLERMEHSSMNKLRVD
jgi:hypothetical protein